MKTSAPPPKCVLKGAQVERGNRDTHRPLHVVNNVEFQVRIGLEFQVHGWIIFDIVMSSGPIQTKYRMKIKPTSGAASMAYRPYSNAYQHSAINYPDTVGGVPIALFYTTVAPETVVCFHSPWVTYVLCRKPDVTQGRKLTVHARHRTTISIPSLLVRTIVECSLPTPIAVRSATKPSALSEG